MTLGSKVRQLSREVRKGGGWAGGRVCRLMDGFMGGWVDGWMGEKMDRLMDGWVGRFMRGWWVD